MRQFIGPEQLQEVMQEVLAKAKEAGVPLVLLGGAAMAHYGSPRMTHDIDVASTALPKISHIGRSLTFGGRAFKIKGVDVDWIVRDDEYKALYRDAVTTCSPNKEAGYCVVSPEHLAVMKLAAGREKDEQDLVWLLSQKDLVDRKKVREMVGKYLGGRFAQESFDNYVLEADFMGAKAVGSGPGSGKRVRRKRKR